MNAVTNRNGTVGVAHAYELAIVQGDLAKLTSEERLEYYSKLCESLGLNPLSRPFDYLKLNDKLVLYAKKDATDQLRSLNKVSIIKLERGIVGDLYVVTATARTPDGREDSDMGAASIVGLKGDALVNAMLKAVTKAKRRVTLSICGLGMLDETEIETIPTARAYTEPSRDITADAPPELPTDDRKALVDAGKRAGLTNVQVNDVAKERFGVGARYLTAEQASELYDVFMAQAQENEDDPAWPSEEETPVAPAPEPRIPAEQPHANTVTRPQLAATEPQVRAIYAVARGTRSWDEVATDAHCESAFGTRPIGLTRRQASELIDWLKTEA